MARLSGTWTFTAIAKLADWDQRIVITGSTNADGAHPMVAGSVVSNVRGIEYEVQSQAFNPVLGAWLDSFQIEQMSWHPDKGVCPHDLRGRPHQLTRRGLRRSRRRVHHDGSGTDSAEAQRTADGSHDSRARRATETGSPEVDEAAARAAEPNTPKEPGPPYRYNKKG